MKQITIFSMTLGSKKTFSTYATTWGQLKPEIRNNGVNPDGQRAIVKDLAITLEDDAAVLPDGDIVIMLTPAAVKSGENK